MILRIFGIGALCGSSMASANETVTYSYDAQGRLVTATHSGTVNDGLQKSYEFDATDNRVNVTVTGGANRVIVVPLNGITIVPIPDP